VSREAFGAVPRTRRRDAHTILNGVDIDRLEESQNTREQLKKAWGVPNKKILGFVGRLSWEKNPYLAIAAVRHLPPNWHLVIAGDGPEAEDVRRYAFDRARGRVLFLGVRRDVGDIMRSFDTLIAPSTQEGFGFSVAEAWSVGCPVVSTPVGIAGIWPHFVQVIQSPVHGIQKDVGSIREVLLNQDGTQAARAVLSECSPSTIRRAREHVQSTLSLDAFGKQWSELLYKLSRQTVTRKPKPQVDTAHEPRRWLASVSGTSKQQSVGIGSVRRKRTSRSAG
jgi:glycosyltransferase involved in cell wall biosynthesis